MSTPFDLIIAGGCVIDGSGQPAFRADVGLKDGRIAALDPRLEPDSGQGVIDATNRIVAPGFIDTHAHDDAYLLLHPAGDMKVLQGVTTVVVGNCGFSLAPMPGDRNDFLGKIGEMMIAGAAMPDSARRIDSFSDYLDVLEEIGLGINVVPLVGHATLRINVIGWENRPPTSSELAEMKKLTEEALAAGAAGLSSGLIYVPAIYSRAEEISALAETVGRAGGLYATHMRSEGNEQMAAIEEALAIGRAGKLPVHISHHKIAGRRNWGQSELTLARFEKARAAGQEVTLDQYPYPAGSTMLAAALPPDFAAGGPDVYRQKLKDPAVRRQVKAAIEAPGAAWENLIDGAGFDNLFISSSNRHPDFQGRSLADIADREGRDPFDVFFDLILDEGTKVGMVIFMMDENDIRRIMKHPFTMVGSDGIPGTLKTRIHPRMTGTFPRILGHYVRDEGVLGLEEAVRKMTSLPAQTFRLQTNGLVKEGLDADLVVFDPATVTDQGTYAEPHKAPLGIDYVLVGGRIAVEKGRITGAGSGRVLRRRG